MADLIGPRHCKSLMRKTRVKYLLFFAHLVKRTMTFTFCVFKSSDSDGRVSSLDHLSLIVESITPTNYGPKYALSTAPNDRDRESTSDVELESP